MVPSPLCLFIVPVYLLFFPLLSSSLFHSLCLIQSCSCSCATTSQLPIQSHAGKHLLSLSPQHNETQALQIDVVQLFLPLIFSQSNSLYHLLLL